jgi:HD-GYP domain-containing protein (c-di-GMP phosphodiesterase class II)
MIPKSILKKSGQLSEEEIKIIRKHPLFSVDILSDYGFRKEDLSIIKAHHEKLDGSGYPDGLKGDEIPIQSQIISVADVYDALTSVRAYRNHLPNNKYGHDEAINIMYDMPGLNKVMVTALNKMIASANGVEINSK